MVRSHFVQSSARRVSRDRHGRGLRSAVTGPTLPLLHTRAALFDRTVASTAEFLQELWPGELGGVSFEVAGMPSRLKSTGGIDRWLVIVPEKRVLLFRLPIERLARLNRTDEIHRRLVIESCVFRAVAELLGKDPWDLAPDRFHQI